MTKLRTYASFVVASAIAMALASSAAQAENRLVKVINETNHILVNFRATNAGSTEWGKDHLGSVMIPAGSSFIINLDDESGYCKFDFKGKFDDNAEVVKSGIDVCQVSIFRFTGD